MVHRRDRVLPGQLFLGHQRAQVAGNGPHVAVRQLVPGPGKDVGELLRVLVEAPRDLLVGRIHPQRQVGGVHHRRVPLLGIVRVGHRARGGLVLRCPLVRAGRALREFPLVPEQVLEIIVVPLRRARGPGPFQAAADGVDTLAAAEAAGPAKALLLDAGAFGFAALVIFAGRAVALAEGVAAGNECNGLFVVHRHAGESLANVAGRGHRVRVAVGPLRVDIDQAHLHRTQRFLEFAIAGVALVAQPLGLRTPIDGFVGLPDVGTPAGETEGLEPH